MVNESLFETNGYIYIYIYYGNIINILQYIIIIILLLLFYYYIVLLKNFYC